MLTLQKGNTTDNIVLTLTEKVTITNPYYLFVFTHATTKQEIKFIKSYSDDLSAYPARYNEFTIATTLFTTVGKYVYHVYEQSSSTNTDPTGLNLLENGQAVLLDVAQDVFTEYSPTTSFKVYAG